MGEVCPAVVLKEGSMPSPAGPEFVPGSGPFPGGCQGGQSGAPLVWLLALGVMATLRRRESLRANAHPAQGKGTR